MGGGEARSFRTIPSPIKSKRRAVHFPLPPKMKTALVVAAAAGLSAAQFNYNDTTGTYTCAQPNQAYCVSGSLNSNIILRCSDNAVGQPGNCNDASHISSPFTRGGHEHDANQRNRILMGNLLPGIPTLPAGRPPTPRATRLAARTASYMVAPATTMARSRCRPTSARLLTRPPRPPQRRQLRR